MWRKGEIVGAAHILVLVKRSHQLEWSSGDFRPIHFVSWSPLARVSYHSRAEQILELKDRRQYFCHLCVRAAGETKIHMITEKTHSFKQNQPGLNEWRTTTVNKGG